MSTLGRVCHGSVTPSACLMLLAAPTVGLELVGTSAPARAIDDQTAVKVTDDTVEVVCEGTGKLSPPGTARHNARDGSYHQVAGLRFHTPNLGEPVSREHVRCQPRPGQVAPSPDRPPTALLEAVDEVRP